MFSMIKKINIIICSIKAFIINRLFRNLVQLLVLLYNHLVKDMFTSTLYLFRVGHYLHTLRTSRISKTLLFILFDDREGVVDWASSRNTSLRERLANRRDVIQEGVLIRYGVLGGLKFLERLNSLRAYIWLWLSCRVAFDWDEAFT